MSVVVLRKGLSAELLAELRARLTTAHYVAGRGTAVGGAAAVKHNLQVQLGDPAEARAVELLAGALQSHAGFQAAAWPDAMMRPMFCRYQPGMSYGDHIDAAIMGEPPNLLRCDIAVTVCLNDGADYDGGELIIDSTGLAHSWKGDAGDIILYAADTLHRVAPVTRGSREVAILWVQSLVRDPARRRILFDLKSTIDALEAELHIGAPTTSAAIPAPSTTPSAALSSASIHLETLRRTYFNLIRMWI